MHFLIRCRKTGKGLARIRFMYLCHPVAWNPRKNLDYLRGSGLLTIRKGARGSETALACEIVQWPLPYSHFTACLASGWIILSGVRITPSDTRLMVLDGMRDPRFQGLGHKCKSLPYRLLKYHLICIN